ncbi:MULTISPECIES: hypothetical protein [Streptomyces]|uniref:Uncharacterized protein n=1 Tax=Streptomyces eurythermus TaxID=42237 RepID=A0ABW6Z016_9ACTN|nr:hypothetical protein [Streptomyces sp. DSM 40868]QIS75480.1 hypothetical protein HB370_40670 [Streptomyces sp. DSM 40868]
MKYELRQEQARTKTMRLLIAELSLELEQAKAEIKDTSGIARLQGRR